MTAHWVMGQRPTCRRLTNKCCKCDCDQISWISLYYYYLQELIAIHYISILRVQGRIQNLLQAFQAEAEVRELPIDFWFQDQCDFWSYPENRLLLLLLLVLLRCPPLLLPQATTSPCEAGTCCSNTQNSWSWPIDQRLEGSSASHLPSKSHARAAPRETLILM